MRKHSEQFKKNVSKLVKTTTTRQVPSSNFTGRLTCKSLKTLAGGQPEKKGLGTMKQSVNIRIMICTVAAVCILLFGAIWWNANSAHDVAAASTAESATAIDKTTGIRKVEESIAAGWVPIPLELPMPKFDGTPESLAGVRNLEKSLAKARPAFYAPEGTMNVALEKPVTASEGDPILGTLEMIVDGDKEATGGGLVELGPFEQWVQIDLQQPQSIYAIVFWHYHEMARVYFDIVVQISDDPDFVTNVRTVFNNDTDNSLGLGVGNDKHYIETAEGKLVDAKGVAGRYVRLYSQANSTNDYSHYLEVEVYARPANVDDQD